MPESIALKFWLPCTQSNRVQEKICTKIGLGITYIFHHDAAIHTAAAGWSPATNIIQVEAVKYAQRKRSCCTIYHEMEGTAMWTSFSVVYAVIFFRWVESARTGAIICLIRQPLIPLW